MCFYHGKYHRSLFHFAIVVEDIYKYHTITYTHVLHSSQSYSCKSVDINKFQHCFEIVQKGSSPSLATLTTIHILQTWRKNMESRLFTNKQTKETEKILHWDKWKAKKAAQPNSRSKREHLVHFFHHDMRFFPFCLAFISLRAKICLILLFWWAFFVVRWQEFCCLFFVLFFCEYSWFVL